MQVTCCWSMCSRSCKNLGNNFQHWENAGFIQDWEQYVQDTDLDSFQRKKQIFTCLWSIFPRIKKNARSDTLVGEVSSIKKSLKWAIVRYLLSMVIRVTGVVRKAGTVMQASVRAWTPPCGMWTSPYGPRRRQCGPFRQDFQSIGIFCWPFCPRETYVILTEQFLSEYWLMYTVQIRSGFFVLGEHT